MRLPLCSTAIFALILGGCAFISPRAVPLEEVIWKSTTSNASIRFQNSRVSGSDGCNRFASVYEYRDGTLKISDKMISTMMACEQREMDKADQFRHLLVKIKSFKIKGDQLTVFDDNMSTLQIFVLELPKH